MNEKIKEVTIPLHIHTSDYFLHFVELIFLKLLFEERYDEAEVIKEWDNGVNLEYLEENGYIKILGIRIDEIDLRGKAIELFELVPTGNNLKELAMKMRMLFPQGIKSGGYPVRSNLTDIELKLKNFFKKYKYSEDVILKATEKFVKEKEADGFKFMQLAVYFIEKNGMSSLASYCEMINSGEEKTVSTDDDFVTVVTRRKS